MRKHAVKFLAVAVCALIVAGAVFGVRARQQADIERIFAQMTKAYANCKSYRDSGTFTSAATSPAFQMSDEGTFTTAFVRPDRFRFECNKRTIRRADKWNYIAWRKGKESYFWNGLRQEVQKKELHLAVAAVTGVSNGATATVGMLLPGEMGMTKFTTMRKAEQLADARVDGMECFCIRGKWGDDATSPTNVLKMNPSDITLWIDKKTFLLRRVQRVDSIDMSDVSPTGGTMISKSWVTWKPVINAKIPPQELEFRSHK